MLRNVRRDVRRDAQWRCSACWDWRNWRNAVDAEMMTWTYDLGTWGTYEMSGRCGGEMAVMGVMGVGRVS